MSGKNICLSDYVELLKPGLCLFIGLSAVFGQVTADQTLSSDAVRLGLLVFILACGSAVLNNIQDREYDKNFLRTRHRSLPQKKLPVSHAVYISILMIAAGLAGLVFFYGPEPALIGVLAVLCYNGLYTPFKKKSLLAIVPGSITGMLPPLIGWTSVGKHWMSKEILLIMGIFALWQIPHFFIVLLKAKKNMGTAAERDFPCFTRVFSNTEIRLQILIWTSLYSLGILLFIMAGPFSSTVISVFTGINAFAVLFFLAIIMFQKVKAVHAFAAINLSMLFFMAAGIGDKFFL